MDCTDSLRSTIARHLAGFSVNRADDTGVRAAAVAVAVTDECFGADLEGMPRHAERRPGAALILTRRSSKLRSHPGQWALPGGRIDPGETPEQTALREMREEIGLDLEEGAVLGRLDDFITRSGFIMTPVVIWAGGGREFVANADEVDSIHRIPVTEFLRSAAPERRSACRGMPSRSAPKHSSVTATATAAARTPVSSARLTENPARWRAIVERRESVQSMVSRKWSGRAASCKPGRGQCVHHKRSPGHGPGAAPVERTGH